MSQDFTGKQIYSSNKMEENIINYNFRSLLELFRECKYWSCLGYEISQHVVKVYNKATTIRFVYDNVLMVVMDYNKIIAALSDEERLLFRSLLVSVEKKIAPGLTALTWVSEVSDAYISEVSAVTAEVRIYVTFFTQKA